MASDKPFNGSVNFADNFNILKAAPIDSRFVMDDLSQLCNRDNYGSSGGYAYKGLIVGVPNYGIYYLKDPSILQGKEAPASGAPDVNPEEYGWQKVVTSNVDGGITVGDDTYNTIEEAVTEIGKIVNGLVTGESGVQSVNGLTGVVNLKGVNIPIDIIEGVSGSNVQEALASIATKATTAYVYKGSDTWENIALKVEGNQVGDVWNATTANGNYPAGTNYAWTGEAWDALGGEVDLTVYQPKSDETLATSDKTVVGAINELNTKVQTNTGSIGSLQTDVQGLKTTVGDSNSGLVKQVADNTASIGTINGEITNLQQSVNAKQDAAIDVTIQSESKTTIPDALTALDTALTEVKTTADGAAKVDASNVAPQKAAWKAALGFIESSDLPSLDGYQTKNLTAPVAGQNTVEGALTQLDSDITAVEGSVTTIQENVTAVEGSVATIQGTLDTKQDKTDNSLATTDKTVVGAINEVNTALGTKANDSAVVHLAGEETITGKKTFTGGVSFKKGGYEVRPDSQGSGLEFGFQLDDGGYGVGLSTSSSGLSIDFTANSALANSGVGGNATTQPGPKTGSKIVVTDQSASISAVPSLRDGSAIEVYSKTEVDQKFSTSLTYTVADELPEASAEYENHIYLIPNEGSGQNVKDEYLCIESSDGVYTWEQIGTTEVDLSNYIQTGSAATLASVAFTAGGTISKVDSDFSAPSATSVPSTQAVKTQLDSISANVDEKANVDASNVSAQKSAWKTALGFFDNTGSETSLVLGTTDSEGKGYYIDRYHGDNTSVLKGVSLGQLAYAEMIVSQITGSVYRFTWFGNGVTSGVTKEVLAGNQSDLSITDMTSSENNTFNITFSSTISTLDTIVVKLSGKLLSGGTGGGN